MKDIATIGLLAILGIVLLKKSTPPTIILPKALVAVNTIK